VTRALTRLGVLASLACGLAACDNAPAGLARVRARGELRVATVNEPTSYYLGAHGPQGFEYRLAHALSPTVWACSWSSFRRAIAPACANMLADGRVDIVAAN
jgi:membrane-bound lytic murein transglycosylase MltF